MSAIDEYIEHMTQHAPGHATLTQAAIENISAILARAAEADALRATVAQHAHEYADWQSALTNAGARITTLEAIIREQQQDIAYITAREATIKHNYETSIVELARKLDEARELIEYATHITIYPYTKEALDWLAENAPAPAAAEVTK